MRIDQPGHFAPDQGRKAVIDHGRGKNAGKDLLGRAQAGCKDKGEKHGLVADLRESDHGNGCEEGFGHSRAR